VHISSTIATDGMAGAEYDAAAKAALHGFSRSAAFGLGRDGDILSNVVMAGPTRTDTNTAIITEADAAHYGALAPLGRRSTPPRSPARSSTWARPPTPASPGG
jgi:3-oxoacyl-[acyl-carrier protein] reductase